MKKILQVLMPCLLLAVAAARGQSVPSGYSISNFGPTANYVYNLGTDPSNGDVYYTVGTTDGQMYKFNVSGGTYSLLNSSFALGVGAWHPYINTGIAGHNGAAYLFTPHTTSISSPAPNSILKVDGTTGVSTLVYNSSVVGNAEDGVTFLGDVMYMTDGSSSSNTIYKYDFNTSTFGTLGSNTLPSSSFDAIKACSATNKLYYSANGVLYSVNMTTGALTAISTGLPSYPKFDIEPSGNYAYFISSGYVIRVDLVTGIQSTFASGLAADNGNDLAFGPASEGGYALYIGGYSNIYKITPFAGPSLCNPGTISGPTTLCAGASGTLVDSVSGGTWTSSSVGVATVSSTGVVTALSAGTTVISYSLGIGTGCGAAVTLTVNALPSFTTSGDVAICAGTSAALTASGDSALTYSWSPATGLSSSVGASVTATPSVATTYTVSGTNAFGCVSTSAVTVGINPLPDAGTIVGDSTVNMTGTTALTSTGDAGTWSVSNSRATISAGGVVTGVSAGTVTISYTVTNSCGTAVATKLMTVNTPVVAGAPLVCVGTTTTLAGVPAGGTWTSGNTPLAGVSSGGVVTGLSAGTVNISYNVSGSITVTVVTIMTTPAVITGATSICNGATASLVTTPTGGTWTTSNGAVADISSSGVLSGLSLGTSTISYTLSNGCARSVVTTINDVPSAISGITTLCVGGTTTLSDEVSGGIFTSSNSSMATVIASTGVVTGVTAGTALVSYSIGGCRVSTTVSVIAAPAITGTASACAGATTLLSNTLPGGSWSSSNSLVADVNPSGLVSGIAAGTATISYSTSTGCTRTQVVTINAIPAINGPSTICLGGGSVNLTATPASTTWTSSAPSVATINSSGLLTAATTGSTTISVVTAPGCANSAVISVTSLPAITSALTACAGSTASLTASVSGGTWTSANTGVATVVASTGALTATNAGTTTISYSTGSGCVRTAILTVNALPAITGTPAMCVNGTVALAGSPVGGSWTSTTPAIATVGSTGTVTGTGAGNTDIIYTNLTTGCSRSVVATINAAPGAFTGIPSVCVNSTTALSNAIPGGTWSSNNNTIATVGSTGIVTGIAANTAMITYKIGTCQATIPVTVKALPNAITGGMQTVVGATTTLANTTTGGGTWSSSTPAVGTISAAGVVGGLSAGTTNIIYTGNTTGCAKSTVVTINAAPALPGPRTVCVGSTINISSGTVSVSSWSSSDITKATVSSGVVTGVAAGTATITYVLTAGGWATTDVTVNPLPAAITGTLNVCTGFTTTVNDATPGGLWTSGNTGIATVGTNGVVTGIAASPTPVVPITYTLNTGCRTTANVTVNATPGAISGTASVCAGATMYPYLTALGTGTWSSSNIGIATVPSSNGAVHGVTAGTATITFTNLAGCYSTREVTVNLCPGRGMNQNTTAVAELDGNSVNIALYPNPTKGTFSINTPEAGFLSVYTLDGREVMTRDVNAGTTEMNLPSSLTTGIYMCRFTGSTGTVVSVRLMFERD